MSPGLIWVTIERLLICLVADVRRAELTRDEGGVRMRDAAGARWMQGRRGKTYKCNCG